MHIPSQNFANIWKTRLYGIADIMWQSENSFMWHSHENHVTPTWHERVIYTVTLGTFDVTIFRLDAAKWRPRTSEVINERFYETFLCDFHVTDPILCILSREASVFRSAIFPIWKFLRSSFTFFANDIDENIGISTSAFNITCGDFNFKCCHSEKNRLQFSVDWTSVGNVQTKLEKIWLIWKPVISKFEYPSFQSQFPSLGLSKVFPS